MESFEHYMYVLRCGDGSLYTGYTTNVAARVVAHQEGKGAKYTKSHAPVELVASARFYSKERAMSAEAYFKHLTRAEKDTLLVRATDVPFEDVLRSDLPGFGFDTACEFVNRCLCEKADPAYRDYIIKRLHDVDPKTVVGVRRCELRAIARALIKRQDKEMFFHAQPHALYEQEQIHFLALELSKHRQ